MSRPVGHELGPPRLTTSDGGLFLPAVKRGRPGHPRPPEPMRGTTLSRKATSGASMPSCT